MNHEGAAMMAGERSRPVEPLAPFKVQPFYTVMAQLVRPRKLTTTGNSFFQSKSFKFVLEPQHVNEIRASLTRNAAGLHEFKVQVHLRFRLLDAYPEQEDSYPSNLAVVVNGRYIEIPKSVHSNVPGKAGLPINIVFSCLVAHQVVNTVRLEWCSVLGQEFAVGVFLVRKESVKTLLALIQHRSVQETREMVKQKLKLRACNDDVSIPSYHVSLFCPLSKSRITVPCRAVSCTHLECFDAFNYLQVNEQTPRWVCPVCGERAAYESLVIDELFLDILEKGPGDFVVFQEDGYWTLAEEPQDCNGGAAASAEEPSSFVDVVSLVT